MSYFVQKNQYGKIVSTYTASGSPFIYADDQTTKVPATNYADQAAALVAESTLSGFLAAKSALASISPRQAPFDAAIHIGDVNGGVQPTTITGLGIASATFDGTVLTAVYAQPQRVAVAPTLVLSGAGVAQIITGAITPSLTGFTVSFTENTPAVQDIAVVVYN